VAARAQVPDIECRVLYEDRRRLANAIVWGCLVTVGKSRMAGKKSAPPQQLRAANLTAQRKLDAIPRLEKRISELNAFDPSGMNPEGGDSRVTVLEQAIARTLDSVFGTDTVERHRYASAHHLDRTVMLMMFVEGMQLPDHRPGLEEGKVEAISILKGIVAGFREDLDEFPETHVNRETGSGQTSGL
jgi:hypothetical protein